jgi:WD40 repeat protein
VCHFSPDGQKIISVGMNQTIYIWNSAEFAENSKNTSHGAEVTGCKFSPDGQRFITSGGKVLNVYDTTSGNLLNSWNKGEMSGCFISPDNTRIATILAESKPLNPYETDYSLCILNAKNGQKLNKIQGSEKLPISQTAFGRPESPTRHLLYKCGGFSPDNLFIITAGFGNYGTNLVLWDVESVKPLRTLEGYCNGAETLSLSKDGCFFGVATFSSNTADIWDVQSGKKTVIFKGHETIVYNLGFSPDNAKVVSGGADGKVKIWERSSGEEIITLIGHTGDVRFCGFSNDGKKIITAGSDRTIRVWDLDGKQLGLLPATHEIVIGDLHPTLPLAILGDEAGFVYLLELVGG